MSFKKTTAALMAMGAASLLLLASCGKDPLNGKWTADDMVLEFNTKDGTASLTSGGETASGTYEISKKDKMLVKISSWKEAGEDYTDTYADMDWEQLATLKLQDDGSLLFRDFFQVALTLSGGEGKSVEDLNGEWSFTQENATLSLTFNNADKTFRLLELIEDTDYADEEGSVLTIEGSYQTESFDDISLNLSYQGYPVEEAGEYSMAKDKKSITIEGLTFTKMDGKNAKVEEVKDAGELPSVELPPADAAAE